MSKKFKIILSVLVVFGLSISLGLGIQKYRQIKMYQAIDAKRIASIERIADELELRRIVSNEPFYGYVSKPYDPTEAKPRFHLTAPDEE